MPASGALYLQALSGVQPGDQVKVRLEGAGYTTSQATVNIRPAELQSNSGQSLSLQPIVNSNFTLVYGPVDAQGNITFNGSIRPGVNQSIQVTSSDPTIVTVVQPTIPLNTRMQVVVKALAPGHAQILVQAPPQITNRAAVLDALVGLYQWGTPQVDSPARYLVSKFTIVNPRAVPTTVTISSSGTVPAHLGTAIAGNGAPSAAPLTVTLNPNESRSLYLEADGPGTNLQIQLTAADFATLTGFPTGVSDPLAGFLESGPLNLSLAGGPSPVTAVLYAAYPKRELPLGNAYGPLRAKVAF